MNCGDTTGPTSWSPRGRRPTNQRRSPHYSPAKTRAGAGLDHAPVLYVCENFACQEPVVGLEAIKAEIERWAK